VRICFIADGRSIHTRRWARWFAADADVMLISTTPGAESDGYRVVNLPIGVAPGSRLLRWHRIIRRILNAERPDVVHSHYINEPGWLGAASRWHPFVVTTWGSDIYRAPWESRLARYLNPWALRSADWVTCDSADQAEVIRSWGVSAERVSVIGWGVDRRLFHPGTDGRRIRGQLDIPLDAPILLSPRRWHPNSNIAAIVAAHERLSQPAYLILKRPPGLDSEQPEDVTDAIASSSARDRIRVLGEIEPERLPQLYAAADVVISLCTTDGTAVSVLEAMATGRPVVALRNPSVAEWVTEPGGRLVGGLDPVAVAGAVEGFLFDSGARKRAAALNVAVIEQRADRAVEFHRMSVIYADLVSRRSGSRRHRGR
jgi:glycosyltransferase involved in cell wall biosynthesis